MKPISLVLPLSIVAAVAAPLTTAATPPQSYPDKPIRIIVPFPPGGGNDALIRVISPKLGEVLNQTIVVDNRAGASGNIAAETAARAAPDGYTMLMGFSTVMTTNKSLYKDARFDPVKDFAPITQLATAQYLLVVHPSVMAKNARELIALAKSKPGSLNYASAGIGTPLHLAAELFKRRAEIEIVHVPYKGGGPASAAMLAGESQLMFSSMASSIPQVRANRLRALAVTGLKRSNLVPDIPTVDESALPGFNVTAWGSLVVPAGTPKNIVDLLNRSTLQVLRAPEMKVPINNVGYEPTGTTPEEIAKIIRTESAMWEKIIREANIRAE